MGVRRHLLSIDVLSGGHHYDKDRRVSHWVLDWVKHGVLLLAIYVADAFGSAP
jgi:hypothetical protein